ncbi:hypothetical protein PSTG_13924 [Puccinia striiformis f. sp. tritici PST-78]|uniref:Uncharacterized protein n=1 Tax=Puccinia striiformis f. sp. tritici PST-78 TaxID=1165861 RepID=A0A0L0V0K2_9BASI|nr:hypothetical protein PSTG_13924 [Puccinia striiformis f. sp. tritici PST-78]
MNQELIYDSNQATVTPNINRSADFSDFIRNVAPVDAQRGQLNQRRNRQQSKLKSR